MVGFGRCVYRFRNYKCINIGSGRAKVLPDAVMRKNMFIEMRKQRFEFSFGNAKLWLRFEIQAFYNIENSGYVPFDIISQSTDPKAVRCFLRNGLADWYNSIEDNENEIGHYVNMLMSAEGFQNELTAYIQAAIILALPQASVGNKRKSDAGENILGLMSSFVDVMGASKDEFMSSTVREAVERWERYAIAMGYQKPAEKFSRFDDDD